jgi:transcriptional regulator with XRE-family HTH domain
MIIGERLQILRKQKGLSQGDIRQRTGLFRSYISRVENGHTVPSVETLEKMARALEVPLYQLFYDGEEPPKIPPLLKGKKDTSESWGESGKWASYLHRLRGFLGKMDLGDRQLLLLLATKMTRKNKA